MGTGENMTFEEIELSAFKNLSLPSGLSLPEQLCFFCLRSLYNDYRMKNISRVDAENEKKIIKKVYLSASQNNLNTKAMYAQYQENIRQAQSLKHELIKGARDGLPVETLLDIACKIIAAMTGEDTSYKLIRESLEKRIS